MAYTPLRILTSLASLFGLLITLAPAADLLPNPTAEIQRTYPAVVRINVVKQRPEGGRMQKSRSIGSGSIITPTGEVLTNYHVVQDGVYFTCDLTTGETYKATLVGGDPLTDLAVLRLDLSPRPAGAEPLPLAHFGDSDLLAIGDPVFALGSPVGCETNATRGIISNPSMGKSAMSADLKMAGETVNLAVRWIAHDAFIAPGNSGGPLLNARGEIVGVNEVSLMGLGGAIPGNLARTVARELIAYGRVTRGWSGLGIKERPAGPHPETGVCIVSVAADSPAQAAGLLPGDVILACQGRALATGGLRGVNEYYAAEMNAAPGSAFTVRYLRAGSEKEAVLTLQTLEPARDPLVEFRAWGLVGQTITRALATEKNLPDRRGVFVEQVRGGGPAELGEPALLPGDVILAVEGRPVDNIAALQAATRALLPDEKAMRPVRVGFKRAERTMETIITLQTAEPRRITPQARKAWLGAAVQKLEPALAQALGAAASASCRVTQVYPGTDAERAGLLVGDLIQAIDGKPIGLTGRAGEAEALNRALSAYPIGQTVALAIWRQGAALTLPVVLERQPVPAAEMPWWEDTRCELAVREIAFEDRLAKRLPATATGLIVDRVTPSGWAALGKLKEGDLLLSAAGQPLASLADYRAAVDQAFAERRETLPLIVQRAGETLLIELALPSLNQPTP